MILLLSAEHNEISYTVPTLIDYQLIQSQSPTANINQNKEAVQNVHSEDIQAEQ